MHLCTDSSLTARIMALLERLQQAWRSRAKHVASLLSDTSKKTLPPPVLSQLPVELKKLPPAVAASIPSPLQASSTSTRRDDHSRLPDAMWKPEQEFPGSPTIDRSRMSLSRESQILTRIARVSLESILKPLRLVVLGTFSTGVILITSYEAHVLLDPACSAADAIAFTLRYSYENFNASVIWETREAALVAQSLGLNPEEVLKQLDPAVRPEDAALLLHLEGLYTMRSILAGSMVIAQLLSMVRESMLATTKYVENVYNGNEPPLRGVTERIIRLAGDGSDVTEVSMARYGAHILPVYENPAKWRYLVGVWSLKGWVPCVWQVASGHYGYRHSWAQLDLDASYMLRTTTGKFILCIEADATNLDRAHDLQKPNNDVTLEEAAQAFRMIERAAARKLNRPFRSLNVFLGDSLQLCDTGGTEYVTLRERIRLKKEVDVLIDAKAPLLLKILKWCARFADKHKTIVLDATPLNYAPLQLLLERSGYTVLTPAQAEMWTPPPPVPGAEVPSQKQHTKPLPSTSNSSSRTISTSTPVSRPLSMDKPPPGAKPPTANISDKRAKLPRLIYYPTTSATINAVHSVLAAGVAEPRLCCVLINSPFGLSHLKEIAEYEEQEFYPICAAEIYDDYFRQVRIWTRMGHAPSAIQRELDLRFAPVLEVQKEIALLPRASPVGVKKAVSPSNPV